MGNHKETEVVTCTIHWLYIFQRFSERFSHKPFSFLYFFFFFSKISTENYYNILNTNKADSAHRFNTCCFQHPSTWPAENIILRTTMKFTRVKSQFQWQ